MLSENRFKNIRYYTYYPENFDKGKKYPVLIHLHGAGGRGTDLNILKNAGPIKEVISGRNLPFVVIAPQCCEDTWFSVFGELLEFVNYVSKTEFADPKRIYLSGVSMGGYAAWTVGMTKPEIFAAMLVLCGGGMYWNAGRLKEIPIWAFHGALDNTVYVTESLNMVRAVNSAGGNARLTVYPEADHNCWDQTFSNGRVYEWLLEHKKNQEVTANV